MASVTFIFLAMESTRINWDSGKRMARGIPGKPPPVPASIIRVPGLKLSNLCNGQGMKNMMFIQVIDVLSGNYIDPLVPQFIQGTKLRKLLHLDRASGTESIFE